MLQEKVVVVTGASGALGRVVVDIALARGARVAAVDYAAAQAAPSSHGSSSAASISPMRAPRRRRSIRQPPISASSTR